MFRCVGISQGAKGGQGSGGGGRGLYSPLSFLPLPLLTTCYILGAECKPKEVNVSHDKWVCLIRFPS